ncbi:MAG: HD domain-containing protein [Arcobacter sp.]|nr:HD domain-containing protein [Arcobacter sp.]
MNKNNFNIKIRPTVLSIFIIVVFFVIFLLLSLQYYFLKDLAFNATNNNFKQISEKIEQRISNLDKKNNDIISNLELYGSIDNIPKKGKRHKLLPLISNILKNNSSIYAIYVGKQNGDFYEIINLNIDDNLRKKYNVSKKVKLLVIKIYEENGKRVEYQEFLDENLIEVSSTKEIAKYNPTNRPWYKKALKIKKAIKTDPYMFTNLNGRGITYAKKVKTKNAVIGIDISLKSMSDFLKKQQTYKNSEIYLFRDKNNMTASVNNRINLKNINFNMFKEDLKTKNISSEYNITTINKNQYFTYFSILNSNYATNEYLSILLPLETIMAPYNQKILYSFIFSFIVLLLVIPIVWFSTRLLVSPIHALSKENEKITNRKFNEVTYIKTYISEINDLSNSFVKLSESVQKYEEDQKKLMDSFIEIIASSIDAKSKYTAGHCERVPILTMMIVDEANKDNNEFKDFKLLNEDQRREVSIAAWLHDCGKVTTPEYVVDKATKLETIYNRLHEIRTRFEVIYRDLKIKSLENIINGSNIVEENNKLKQEQELLQKDFEFIAKMNVGSEFLSDEDILKIEEISKKTWLRYFDNTIGISQDEIKRLNSTKITKLPVKENLLDNKKEHIIPREYSLDEEYEKYGIKQEVPKYLYNLGEIYNLSIKRGTLTQEERFKINEHSIISIMMLEQLPFLDNLKNVPEYATAHHETLIGTGYPRKLTKEDMSLPARIIAVADVFEALTSSDRPYKKPKSLSESIKILSFMVKDKHLDEDIFQLFLKSGIYMQYAKQYLNNDQIDSVDINKYIS